MKHGTRDPRKRTVEQPGAILGKQINKKKKGSACRHEMATVKHIGGDLVGPEAEN